MRSILQHFERAPQSGAIYATEITSVCSIPCNLDISVTVSTRIFSTMRVSSPGDDTPCDDVNVKYTYYTQKWRKQVVHITEARIFPILSSLGFNRCRHLVLLFHSGNDDQQAVNHDRCLYEPAHSHVLPCANQLYM